MSEWVKVGLESDLTENVGVFDFQGKPVAVFHLEDGYYAIDDVCSHEEASLAEGEIENGKVECPLHGAMFNIRTGKNLTLPAVLPVKSYLVKIDDGEIYLKIKD